MLSNMVFFVCLAFLVVSAGVVLIKVAAQAARRPLTGIPFNEAALKTAFGDVTELNQRQRGGETSIRPWFLEQAARHNSALVQIFLGPFAKPAVLLSDYREILDILTHRDADFKRGKKVDVFHCASAIIPERETGIGGLRTRDDGGLMSRETSC